MPGAGASVVPVEYWTRMAKSKDNAETLRPRRVRREAAGFQAAGFLDGVGLGLVDWQDAVELRGDMDRFQIGASVRRTAAGGGRNSAWPEGGRGPKACKNFNNT